MATRFTPCEICEDPARCRAMDRCADRGAAVARYASHTALDSGTTVDIGPTDAERRMVREALAASDLRLQPLPSAGREAWRRRRQLAEDIILTGLVLVGAITVLRWILDATGAGAWLGWWG